MTTVGTRDGAVRGQAHDGAIRFLGIPYAAPPVGPLRWRPPEPPGPWTGDRDALAFGPMAPQPRGGAQFTPSSIAQAEDCLTLNVWTPSTSGRRPVMVWFHGGAYRQGSTASPLYEGSELARRGDVVVVTVNYRLGALGFLAHPELRQEDGAPAGNWGLLDQLESLRWVRDNAAAFGGDPANVTIFGESAGGGCVSVLLAAPPAAGLFHKAIVQSSAPFALTMDQAARTAERVCEAAGVGAVADLAELSAEEILTAQTAVDAGGGAMRFLPVVDDHLLDRPPLERVRDGLGNQVPVVIGTNRDEWKLWAPADPRSRDLDDEGLRRRLERRLTGGVDDVIELFRKSRSERGEPDAPNDLWFAIESERFFRAPAIDFADALSTHAPTFVYLFTWPSPAMKGWLGACHGLEIAFAFGTQGRAELAAFTGSGPEADRLGDRMLAAWAAFAHRGDPSTDELGSWPHYGLSRPTMVLGRQQEVVEAPFDGERAAVAQHSTGRAG